MKDMGETQKKVFGYFRAYEAEQFSFYRIPKVLFTDEYFQDLSTDAKVLYGLMLDRMGLSERNRWFDEEGRVYIIFTVEEVATYMNCGRVKGMKLLAELDMKKGIGLIERVKRGFGQSDIIYVKNFIRAGLKLEQETACPDDQNVSLHEEEKERTPRSEKRTYRGSKSGLIEVRKTNLSGFEKRTYRGSKSEPVEVRKTNLSRSEKQTYRGSKSRLIEVRKTDPNNTDKSETESNNTDKSETESNKTENSKTDRSEIDSIYPSDIEQTKISNDIIDIEQTTITEQTDKKDQMKQFEFYTELVKQNISYDMLRHDCKKSEEQLLDEIVAIVAEFLSMPRETALIGGVKYPYQYVRNRFLLLDDAHIRYVLECFRKNTTEVRNIKAYLLSSMLNATNTIDLYYQAKAQHDLHADGMT